MEGSSVWRASAKKRRSGSVVTGERKAAALSHQKNRCDLALKMFKAAASAAMAAVAWTDAGSQRGQSAKHRASGGTLISTTSIA